LPLGKEENLRREEEKTAGAGERLEKENTGRLWAK